MSTKALGIRLIAALVAAAAVSVVIAACGGDDDGDSQQTTGNATEQAFLEGMVPHHRSAVAMAQIAEQRAEHGEVKQLAGNIIVAQQEEIRQMHGMHERLFGSELDPDAGAHDALGLEEHETGTEVELRELREANPFDRAFIDMMVPHHEGAISQARAVLREAKDPEVKRLAQAIVSAQSTEIRRMNQWRKRWYGSGSPSGESGGGHMEDAR
jgi:uncharacterized protein (DUF305 family)